jgi:hypothetical protein
MAGQVFLSFASAFFMRYSEEGKRTDENPCFYRKKASGLNHQE